MPPGLCVPAATATIFKSPSARKTTVTTRRCASIYPGLAMASSGLCQSGCRETFREELRSPQCHCKCGRMCTAAACLAFMWRCAAGHTSTIAATSNEQCYQHCRKQRHITQAAVKTAVSTACFACAAACSPLQCKLLPKRVPMPRCSASSRPTNEAHAPERRSAARSNNDHASKQTRTVSAACFACAASCSMLQRSSPSASSCRAALLAAASVAAVSSARTCVSSFCKSLILASAVAQRASQSAAWSLAACRHGDTSHNASDNTLDSTFRLRYCHTQQARQQRTKSTCTPSATSRACAGASTNKQITTCSTCTTSSYLQLLFLLALVQRRPLAALKVRNVRLKPHRLRSSLFRRTLRRLQLVASACIHKQRCFGALFCEGCCESCGAARMHARPRRNVRRPEPVVHTWAPIEKPCCEAHAAQCLVRRQCLPAVALRPAVARLRCVRASAYNAARHLVQHVQSGRTPAAAARSLSASSRSVRALACDAALDPHNTCNLLDRKLPVAFETVH